MPVEQEKVLSSIATDTFSNELTLAFWFLSIPVSLVIGYCFHLIGENSRRRQDKALIEQLQAVNNRQSKENRASEALVDELREKLFLSSNITGERGAQSEISAEQGAGSVGLALKALDDPHLPEITRSLVKNILYQSCPTCGEPSPSQGYGVNQAGEGCRLFVCSDDGQFEVLDLEEWV